MTVSRHPGVSTPNTGQSFILIDPDAGLGAMQPFADRVATLLNIVREAGQDRLPGDRRHVARERAEREGILVPDHILKKLDGLAA